MTDRERFEFKAKKCGAIILQSDYTVLTTLSANGKIITTYFFDLEGSFQTYLTKTREVSYC